VRPASRPFGFFTSVMMRIRASTSVEVSVLLCASAPAFFDLGRSDRPRKRTAQRFRRLQREFHGDPGTRPERRVQEVDGDGLFQQSVMRVVVRHHGLCQIEPPVTALAGTARVDTLNDRGAHALGSCSQVLLEDANTFFQPSSACSMRYIGRS
jgi:hypothetical protein